MNPNQSVNAILDTLTSQQQQGETSLVVRIEPDLIADLVEAAMNAFPGYRKVFAPSVPGVTDTLPIRAAYEQMQARGTQRSILLFVECQTLVEFRAAIGRLPLRNSSEWRSFDDGQFQDFTGPERLASRD